MKASLLYKYILSVLILFTFLFSNESVPTKDEVTKLYIGTFNRPPDVEGLNYWINDSGLTLSQISQSFFDQVETQKKYPNTLSTESFIRNIYNNLFLRGVDKKGLTYWKKEINEGTISRGKFILTLINAAESETGGQYDYDILSQKTELATHFINAGLGKNDFPNILDCVDFHDSTVSYLKEQIDNKNDLDKNTCYGYYSPSDPACAQSIPVVRDPKTNSCAEYPTCKAPPFAEGCDSRELYGAIANAGDDITEVNGVSIFLDASSSYPVSGGTIESYEWKEGSTILSNSVSFSKLDFSIGIHEITLTIMDSFGAIDTDIVIVTITDD